MKTVALILAGITAIAALGALYSYSSTSVGSMKEIHDRFLIFKSSNSIAYDSPIEHEYRFKVFSANLKLIEEANSDSKNTFTVAVNKFADKTYEELSALYLTNLPSVSEGKCTVQKVSKDAVKETNVDWTTLGKVQAVKNQGQCGSCWAFSAVAAIESAIAIKTGSLPNISEQELVDCSRNYGNQGCDGGLMNWGFDYVIDHHINNASDYPYKASDQKCKTDTIGEGKNAITSCVKATPTIDGLVEAITVQPTSVAFHVTQLFFFYHGGIYNPWFCMGQPNHGVLAVGFSTTDKTPFFKVKNSWGASWGEQGFFRIAFGKGQGTCKIAGNGSNYYPVV
jgi:C1A family cysteine protease